ncbi:hypothetical protein [Streptomyces sp. NPDC058620]|uniref:hypothetical protein n=1 Tax=Streptomyces sp. NPDC058620 TaxID=3346560 RepID=UPI0036566D81
MIISFGLPVVLVWLLLAVIPVRNASARRLWIGIYAGASLLILLGAFIYCADGRRALSADNVQEQYLPLIMAAAGVGPGLLLVLIRLVVSRPEPAPPVVQYLPPQHYAPYPPPYGQHPYPPAQQQPAPQGPSSVHPVPPAAPPPPATPPTV